MLGTGGGDVLALDIASGQLTWRLTDCHPGLVRYKLSCTTFSLFKAGINCANCEDETLILIGEQTLKSTASKFGLIYYCILMDNLGPNAL